MPRDKLLDIEQHDLTLAGPVRMVTGGVFDVFDAPDRRGELAAKFDGNLSVDLTM